jgi:hypothetical protein
MSLQQAASMSNLDPEAPEKSSEFRPLSACGHPPRGLPQARVLSPRAIAPRLALRLCACTHPNTSTRRRAGRIRTQAPTEPGGRPRPGWRPTSHRAGAHGL